MIDAKHSNQYQIAPSKVWLDRCNGRIGIFGGVDKGLLCRADEETIQTRTQETLRLAEDHSGFAIGCGNTIADYRPVEKFLVMVQAVRRYRDQ